MVDTTKLFPLDSFVPESTEDDLLFQADVAQAREFLSEQPWCETIQTLRLGLAVPGIVLVAFAEIVPRHDEDPHLWLVVGDVPPAYLVTDYAPNPGRALRVYIDEMLEWVDAVEAGRLVDDLIPVNVAPTAANARALRTRLTLLEQEVLVAYRDDLDA
jgi:hypothetical protein